MSREFQISVHKSSLFDFVRLQRFVPVSILPIIIILSSEMFACSLITKRKINFHQLIFHSKKKHPMGEGEEETGSRCWKISFFLPTSEVFLWVESWTSRGANEAEFYVDRPTEEVGRLLIARKLKNILFVFLRFLLSEWRSAHPRKKYISMTFQLNHVFGRGNESSEKSTWSIIFHEIGEKSPRSTVENSAVVRFQHFPLAGSVATVDGYDDNSVKYFSNFTSACTFDDDGNWVSESKVELSRILGYRSMLCSQTSSTNRKRVGTRALFELVKSFLPSIIILCFFESWYTK